jgi:hypothetical protein
MEYRRRLCLTEGRSLLRDFGRGCVKPWIPNCVSVLLIILRPMVRTKEWIRFWKICWELVLCNMEEVGIIVCRMPSSPTTIVIKRVWRWHRLRCYMDVGVEPRCFGMKLENERFLDLTYCERARSKFVCLGRTFVSRNRDKRATSIVGEEN